jgi:fatty acid desaturase
MTTVAGRLVLGPPYFAARVWREMAKRLLAGDWPHMRQWFIHIPAAAIVLLWVMVVCDIPLWQYVLLYAWPGVSLTVLRSYLEHQGRAEVGHRTVIIESGPIMSLMYLNNNLHALHHLEPAAGLHLERRLSLSRLWRHRRAPFPPSEGAARPSHRQSVGALPAGGGFL